MPRKGRRGRSSGNNQSRQIGAPQNNNSPQNRQQQPQQRAATTAAAEVTSEGRVIVAEKPQVGRAGQVIASVLTPRRQIMRKQMHQRNNGSAQKTYGVVFYDTLQAVKADLANLRNIASQFDQLNIVIKAEGPIDDAEVEKTGKIFAGAAWTLIHERRKIDGWYDTKNE